jgi:predicted PurR-regulated permease PerM
MLGVGTIINPIIKIVTAVAILAAVYFFILKPVLETTDNVVDRSFDAFDQSLDGFDQLPDQVQGEVNRAFDQANGSQRLQDCIERAVDQPKPEINRVNRCVERFTP